VQLNSFDWILHYSCHVDIYECRIGCSILSFSMYCSVKWTSCWWLWVDFPKNSNNLDCRENCNVVLTCNRFERRATKSSKRQSVQTKALSFCVMSTKMLDACGWGLLALILCRFLRKIYVELRRHNICSTGRGWQFPNKAK